MLVVLAIASLSLVAVNILNTEIEEKYVIIKADKDIVEKILIDHSIDKKYSFKFKDEVGFLQVKNGKVRMLRMNDDICPRKICSETGWIENSIETIVCLPNKIVVSLEQKNENNEDNIDVLSF